MNPPHTLKSGSEVAVERVESNMRVTHTEIRVKGQTAYVPSVHIDGRTVIVGGGWLKMATVQDEDLLEGDTISDPSSFLAKLRQTELKADVFTFAQKLPHTAPKYKLHLEWDNAAVIPITTYAEWLEKRVESSVRRAVKKAAKSGVTVRIAEFDDELVRGIVNINNETPIRQGKPFWHFQKSFDAVKLENATYAERNVFLAAYHQDEVIGYIRMTHVDGVANIVQLLSMMKHFDKRPANALVAKAVEVCEQQGMSHLQYCNYVYNDPKSSLTEFKRRNGFEKVLLPRYYVPLTLKGKIAISVGLHLGVAKCLPTPLVTSLLKMRNQWYARKVRGAEE
jgi:hypothetical protein